MASTLTSARPSLERLKALDSIPHLESQIAEAWRLCTHGARADMVLKWLLEKIKKSAQARSYHSTWDLLSHAARLSSPEKIATLSGSGDILRRVEETLTEHSADLVLFGSVHTCMKLLLDMAESGKGAALKAVLSLDAVAAAGFAGLWLTRVHEHAVRLGSREAIAEILLPASRIWDLRKRRTNDNELFAHSMLVPAALLQKFVASMQTSSPLKRKRNAAASEDTSLLEAMIARHIFLPSRTAFFEAHDRYSPAARKPLVTQPASLEELLAPLKKAEPMADGKLVVNDSTVPGLLDIALRCVPLPTQRHRQKEKPWIETVFAALLDCLTREEELSRPGALIDMLVVVESRASLSTQTLLQLAKRYGGFSPDEDAEPDWNLLAQLVKLDSGVFASKEMAAILFSKVSEAEQKGLEEGMKAFLQESILIPIMRAMARNRSLPTCLELWLQQLQRNDAGVALKIWSQVGEHLAPLVEDALPQDQLRGLISRFHQNIRESFSRPYTEPSDADQNPLPFVVVLGSLIGGLHRPDLIDALSDEIDRMFETLFGTSDDDSTMKGTHSNYLVDKAPFWTLCTKIVEFGIPFRGAKADDKESWMEQVPLVISSATFKAAEKLSRSARDRSGDQNAPERVITAVKEFLATVCHFLRRSDDSGRVLEAVDRAAALPPVGDVRALIKYPSVLDDLQEDIRNDALFGWTSDASDKSPKGDGPITAVDTIRSLIATAVSSSQKDVLEDVVRVVLTYVEPAEEDDDPSEIPGALAGLRVLSELPANALTAAQRERVLNAVAAFEPLQKEGPECFRMRLVLMNRMLEQPCPNADICVTPSSIWRLAVAGHDAASNDPIALKLFDDLISTLLRRLVAKQSREEGRERVKELADTMNKSIGTTCSINGSGFGDNLYRLGLIRSLVAELTTGLRPPLSEECVDLDSIEIYVRRLLDNLKTVIATEPEAHDRPSQYLLTMLDCLASVPRSTVEASLVLKKEYNLHLKKSINTILFRVEEQLLLGPASSVKAETAALLVQCFHLLCRLQPADDRVTALAKDLLSQSLQPHERETVLTSFTDATADLSGGQKIELFEKLLSQDDRRSTSTLLLVRIVIAALKQDDFEATSDLAPQQLLHQLLLVLKQSQRFNVCRKACECVVAVLREKSFRTNQFSIESTVATLNDLATRTAGNSILFLDVCRILTVLLQQHRSRLSDRLHLVVELLQTLVTDLFRGYKAPEGTRHALTARHGRVLARVLQLLCNPPQYHGRSHSSDLVDQARKSQAHVGQNVQYVLHHYCTQVLRGKLGEGVREALMPGLWAMVEAMEVNDAEAMKSLSTAMNGSERAVLRGVYEEYKTFGKWKGG